MNVRLRAACYTRRMSDTAPFGPSDIFAFTWIRDARLAPGGATAVYEVTRFGPEDRSKPDEADPETGKHLKEYSDLFIVDVASGEGRQLTSADTVDSGARWSPDGRTIAFARTSGEVTQVYTITVDGGEPRQRTSLSQGASSPCWSPDGKQIAFVAGTDWGKEKPERSKDPYLVTRSVWRFDAIGDLDMAVSNVHVLYLETDETTQLTDSPTRDQICGWLPDGSGLVLLCAMKPDDFRSLSPELRLVSDDGEETTLVPLDWGMIGDAAVAPSGLEIVIVGRPNDGAPIGTSGKLYRVPIVDGIRTKGPVSPVCIHPDTYFDPSGSLEGRIPAAIPTRLFASDDRVFCNSQTRGTAGVYCMGSEATPELLVGGDRSCHLVDRQADRLLILADDINSAPYLMAANLDGSGEKVLARTNEEQFDGIEPLEIMPLEFSGTDGVSVDGWFVRPSGATGPMPTILWIHGGPHGAQGHRFAYDTWMLTSRGYAVMFVNHRASTGYGDAFATAIKGDWGNLDHNDLMAGVDEAIAQGLADPDRLGVCGISGGGNLSCWIVGHTDRFKAAIPQNPVTNWVSFYGVSDIGVWFSREQMGGEPHEIPEVYARCSPITTAHRCTTPTLLIQNEADWRCPPEQSEQFYTVLRANGCEVEMLRHPAAAHGGSVRGPLQARVSHLRHTLRWFNRFVLEKDA